MLACQFKTEKGRKGYLDFPAELRNIVYELAMFGYGHAFDSPNKLGRLLLRRSAVKHVGDRSLLCL
jgi:hypothetical protein